MSLPGPSVSCTPTSWRGSTGSSPWTSLQRWARQPSPPPAVFHRDQALGARRASAAVLAVAGQGWWGSWRTRNRPLVAGPEELSPHKIPRPLCVCVSRVRRLSRGRYCARRKKRSALRCLHPCKPGWDTYKGPGSSQLPGAWRGHRRCILLEQSAVNTQAPRGHYCTLSSERLKPPLRFMYCRYRRSFWPSFFAVVTAPPLPWPVG